MQKLLSQALDFASTIVCNGYEIDDVISQGDCIRLDTGDDEEFTFMNQAIDINSDGEARVKDVDGEEWVLIFKICIPIRECDFSLPKRS